MLKTVQGLFEAFARAPAPEVPALLHEVVRPRNLQAVSQLGPIADPEAEFAQDLLDLSNGDRDGVFGNQVSIPRLIDHLRVADIAATVVNQGSEGMKSLGAKLQFLAITQQRRG